MYFTTFGNAHKNNAVDLSKTFNGNKPGDWQKFKYEDRLKVASLVKKKNLEMEKLELAKSKDKKLKAATLRNKVTEYIKLKNSRQEFVPILERYIDLAVAEPLHLKNNICKEMFVKVLKVVEMIANIENHVKQL